MGGSVMSKKVIGVLVGSLRKESFSRKIANYVCELFPDDFEVKKITIGDLAMFNQDYDDEGTTPQEWIRFRQEVKEADAVLFVTPEYNRSVPPLLKNAIDIASRPPGKNVWQGKPGAVISVAPGRISGFGSNHHLRQSMVVLDVYMMQQPEAYIGNVEDVLDEKGKVVDKRTQDFLENFVKSYVNWIEKLSQ